MENTEQLQEEVKLLRQQSKEIKKRARENYLEQVSDIKERIKQIGDEAGVKAKQVIDNVGEYINENPQRSALIGLGVGLSVGVILGMLLRKDND